MSDPLQALRAVSGTDVVTTTSDLPSIPAVPAAEQPGVTNFLSSIKTWIEKVSDASLGGFVTKKFLAERGIITTDNGDVTFPDGPPILLTPPTPTGLTAAGALTNIILEWTDPVSLYKNHGYTEVWASGDSSFTNAVLVGESSGFMFAHAVGESSDRWYWIRFKSIAGILGPFQSVNGLHAQTAEDPVFLLSVLNNSITESQLYTDLNTRINLIDTAGPADLPNGLIAKVRAQQSDVATLTTSANTIGEKLLETALKVQTNTDLLYDAGLTIDPGTGQVYIFGVREADNRLDAAEIRLNAAEANINLKTTSAYVDAAIAAAVIDPSQVAELGGLTARIGTAEIDISGLNAAVATKAELVTVNSQGVRLTTAESDIDALQGQIINKVETATFNTVENRVTTAEQNITTLNGSGIINAVQDISWIQKQQNKDAETVLRNVLTGEYTLNESRAAVALARTELTAQVTDGLAAEAVQRLALAAAIDSNAAAIQSVQTAYATADSALATSITNLTSTVNNNTAAIQTVATTTDGITAQYMVKIDNNGTMSGFGLSSDLIDGAAPTSKFIASVNQFAVVAPMRTAGQLNSVPFAVLTTPQTINGVAFPAGVYIDGASINAGTIGNAQIGNAAIDSAKIADAAIVSAKIQDAAISTAKINDAAITSAKIATAAIQTAHISDAQITNAKIADTIQSNNYSAGLSGWKIDKSGSAEFQGATITGNITANSVTAGATITSPVINGGEINGVTGTFSGALSAATGTFSGSLSAANGTLGALVIASGGSISQGQTGFNAGGSGFWLGDDGGTPKFSVGSPTGNSLTWDGINLRINASIDTYTAGNFILISADAAHSFDKYSTTYVKYKEIAIDKGGVVRVGFDVDVIPPSETGIPTNQGDMQWMVKINGGSVSSGTVFKGWSAGETLSTYTAHISNDVSVGPGDLITLWAKAGGGITGHNKTYAVKNFRLYVGQALEPSVNLN